MATTDASGNVVNTYTYDVYGKTTASSGSQPNSFQFAGHQTDPTGLQYLRARYYDPSTGSFLSRDPLSAIPGWQENPFGYAGANPAKFSDPTGLCRWWDLQCKVEGPVHVAEARLGTVVDSVGDAAIQLVKLGGEYSLQFGAGARDFLLDHQAALKTVAEAVLTAAFLTCGAGGVETAGAACVGAAFLAGALISWDISSTLTHNDKPEALKVIEIALALSQLVYVPQPWGLIRDIWQDIGDPKEAH